ncbi:MAG: hypothetical protein JW862_11785 [Anaerolineales bacterium]|nr:hypothetical protein [Anaerolineales bacterium]
MLKKLTFPILLSLLLAALFSGAALAAEPEPQAGQGRGGLRAYGEITALGDTSFSLATPQGAAWSFEVTDRTRYRAQDITEPGFDDLAIGQKVMVLARRDADGSPNALLVVLLPADFNPGDRFGLRAAGRVTAVGSDHFTLQKPDGNQVTFLVDTQTNYRGQASQLSDLQPNWYVAAAGQEQADGTYLARLVVAAPQGRPHLHAGTVVSVNSDSFLLHTRNGQDLTIYVNADTSFHSPDGSVNSLADLQTDMPVSARVRHQLDGSELALRVLSRP